MIGLVPAEKLVDYVGQEIGSSDWFEVDQDRIDMKTEHLSLYNFANCPFCIKVRRFIHESNINIEILDAANDDAHKSDLMNYGGKYQAPCLRISEPNGEDEWLYESDDIISYLKKLIAGN